jgi:phosphohistidine phosphatase SixA
MVTTQRLRRCAALAALLGLLGLLCGGGRPAAPNSAASASPARGGAGGDNKYPRQILIIRHAEKPKKAGDVHLSKRGKERAKQMFALFAASAERPAPFPTPDFLFATHNTDNSHRPRETVKPLAMKLGLPLNTEYHNKEGKNGIQGLSDEIFSGKQYAGKTVLVCWHHGTIPDLVKALLARAPNAAKEKRKVPKRWRDEVFDAVWLLTFEKDGKATFTVRPQRLLPGDTPGPRGERRSRLAPRAEGWAPARRWARAG